MKTPLTTNVRIEYDQSSHNASDPGDLPKMQPEELIVIREALGISQTEMGRRMGVRLRTIQHWEAGDRSIPGPAVLLARRIREEITQT